MAKRANRATVLDSKISMTLSEIEAEIKHQAEIIQAAKKRLEQLFVLRETQMQLENGQITIEELL